MGFEFSFWCSICQEQGRWFPDKRKAQVAIGLHRLGSSHQRVAGLNRRDKPKILEGMPSKSTLMRK